MKTTFPLFFIFAVLTFSSRVNAHANCRVFDSKNQVLTTTLNDPLFNVLTKQHGCHKNVFELKML